MYSLRMRPLWDNKFLTSTNGPLTLSIAAVQEAVKRRLHEFVDDRVA
jgi:hypothetical protein